jgi:hypothetical protein
MSSWRVRCKRQTGMVCDTCVVDRTPRRGATGRPGRLLKELGIKACAECCFSTGGHLFAAANGATIAVFNAYTCENVGNLRHAPPAPSRLLRGGELWLGLGLKYGWG